MLGNLRECWGVLEEVREYSGLLGCLEVPNFP